VTPSKFVRHVSGIISISLALGMNAHAQDDEGDGSWWDQSPWAIPDRGFNWYPPKKPAAKIETETQKQKQIKPVDIREMKTVEEVRKELVRLREVAIMVPSEQNISRYLDANQYVMDKAQQFTEASQHFTWQHPKVDYNAVAPHATFAQLARRQQQTQDTDALLKRLATTYGILFFFRSDCPYCHMEAPIMKMLRDRYGIEVMAISMDGGGISEFPDYKPDNGISTIVSQGQGVDTVPAMYLISRDEKHVIALGAGAIALDELAQRIRELYSSSPDSTYEEESPQMSSNAQ
jgi:conjugal transfer pilus assembly protein TraF